MAVNHPSQTQQSSLIMDQEEPWFHYFDQAVENVDLAHVMTVAESVCSTSSWILPW